jgi:hypothetical protein
MSSNTDQHKDYLHLMLTANPPQQKALLFTSNEDQLDVLSEIFHNFLTLPLAKEERQFVKRREEVIAKLADISKSPRSRRQIINKHSRQIIKILEFFKDNLLSIIPTT